MLDIKIYCKGLVVYSATIAEGSGAVVEASVALRHHREIFHFFAFRLEDKCGKGFRGKRQKNAALILNICVRLYLIPQNVPNGHVGHVHIILRAVQLAHFFCKTCFSRLTWLCCYHQLLPRLSCDVPVEENMVNSQTFGIT